MEQMKINTPDNEMPVSTKTLIHQADRIKFRSEWSNGFVLITDQHAEETYINPSHKLIQQPDGSFNIDLSSPNPNFIDEG